MANFLYRMSDEDHQALEQAANAEGVSMQEFVRLSVEDRIGRGQNAVRGIAEAITAEDSELLERLRTL